MAPNQVFPIPVPNQPFDRVRMGNQQQQQGGQQDMAGILQAMLWQNAMGQGQLGGTFPSYDQQMQGPPRQALAGLTSARDRAASMRQDSLSSIANVLGSYIPSYMGAWSTLNNPAPRLAAQATRDSSMAGAMGQMGSSAYNAAGDIYSAGIPAQMQYATTPASLSTASRTASYAPQASIYDSYQRETGRDRRMASLPGLLGGLLGSSGFGGGLTPFRGFRTASGAGIS